MPVEFSVAAYRFGHSMIRPDYELNPNAVDIPIYQVPKHPNSDKGDLRGFRHRPKDRQIEWHRFFEFPSTPPDELQQARQIQTKRDGRKLGPVGGRIVA